MREITFHGTKAELLEKLHVLPSVLAGKPSVSALARRMGNRLANVFLKRCQESFLQKSSGRTGDDMVKWNPHAAATIAKRAKRDRKRQIVLAWHKIKAQAKVRGLPDFQATAAINETFPLLHEDGKLLDAFTPGESEQAANQAGQEITVQPGEVTVKITEKPFHHTGFYNVRAKRNVDPRPFWPLTGGLPETYWRDMLESYHEGMSGVLEDYLTGVG